MKIYCNWTSGYVSFIWLPLFGKVISNFSSWISAYLIYSDQWFVCLLYSALPSNMFYWVLFSFYRTPEDRTKLPVNLHSWKNDLFQTNCLVFVVFLMYNFHLSLTALYYFVRRRRNYPISSFWMVLRVLFAFIFWCFLKCYLL